MDPTWLMADFAATRLTHAKDSMYVIMIIVRLLLT